MKIKHRELSESQQLVSLELARFIASFIVVYAHYVHFYMYFNIDLGTGYFSQFNNPYNGLAVPFFFLISGAIFTHVYFKKIATGGIGFVQYFKRRFARLYPLHFATLLLVGALQYFVFKREGQYFIYEQNDLYHFVLNLFLISHWGIETGHSFNAPVWSVSNEIFLYLLFFALIWFVFRRLPFARLGLLAMPIILLVCQEFVNHLLLKSAFAFFVGAAIYVAVDAAKHYKIAWLGLLGLFLMSSAVFWSGGIPHGSIGPCILLICLYADTHMEFGEKLRSLFSYLGNLTYAMYLMHFPLQLTLLLIGLYVFELDFAHHALLLIYLALTILLAAPIFRYFESPMRRTINLMQLSRKRSAPPQNHF